MKIYSSTLTNLIIVVTEAYICYFHDSITAGILTSIFVSISTQVFYNLEFALTLSV